MTHTTTDAAEARDVEPYFTLPFALHEAEGHGGAYIRDARGQSVAMLMWPAHAPDDEDAAVATLYAIGRSFAAALAPATAEAASGAGEREKVSGDDWPAEWKSNGFNGAITQAQKALRYLADHDRPSGGEQFPNAACCHMIADELEVTRKRYAALASLPPATDPAKEKAAHILARVSISHMVGKCGWKSYSQAEAGMREVLAALAAAPTIPATGEAIPEGMKTWRGGDGPPEDWDGGRVLWHVPYGRASLGAVLSGDNWQRHDDQTGACSIAAYTPKATIPATGHAATEGEG